MPQRRLSQSDSYPAGSIYSSPAYRSNQSEMPVYRFLSFNYLLPFFVFNLWIGFILWTFLGLEISSIILYCGVIDSCVITYYIIQDYIQVKLEGKSF